MLSGRVRKTYGRRAPRPRDGSDDDTETDEPGSSVQQSRVSSPPNRNGTGTRPADNANEVLDDPSTASANSVLSSASRTSAARVPSAGRLGSPASNSSSLRRASGSGSVNTPPPLKRRRTLDPAASMPPPALSKSSSKPTTPTSSTRLRPRNSPVPASPRDLSALFAAVSPASAKSDDGAPAPPRRRKMLSKAQSMVLPPSPPKDDKSRPKLTSSQSLPISPTKKDAGDEEDNDDKEREREHTPPRALAPLPEPTSGGAKRTYGKGRSYLASAVEMPEDEPRESYAELRKRYEVDNGEHPVLDGLTGEQTRATESFITISGGQGNLIDELMMAKAPESVSDMRSKGENRQFMDEVAYYLEGLQGTNAMRRTSALDILGSMRRDQEWLTKMHVCGQTEPVFEGLVKARGDDGIMETACLLFLYIVIHAGFSIEQVLIEQPSGVMQVIGKGLGMSAGPLDDAYIGKVTANVTRLRTLSKSVETQYEDEAPPTRYLAASILSHILQDADQWSNLRPAFEEAAVGLELLIALALEVNPLRSRVELYSKGLDLLPKDPSVDLPTIEHCLMALSHRFVVTSIGEADLKLQPLYDVLVVMAAALTDEDAELRLTASRCAVLALEVLTPAVSLAHVRDDVSKEVVASLGRVLLLRRQICDTVNSEHTSEANIESYVLALFGSLALAGPHNVSLLSSTYVSDCRKRACSLTCRCSPRPLPYHLAELYLTSASPGEDDAALTDFLHGYLALLLAKVLVNHPGEPAKAIYTLLPGETTRQKIQGVLDTLRDFNSVNEEFVKRVVAADSQSQSQGAENGDGQRDETIEGIGRTIVEVEKYLEKPDSQL